MSEIHPKKKNNNNFYSKKNSWAKREREGEREKHKCNQLEIFCRKHFQFRHNHKLGTPIQMFVLQVFFASKNFNQINSTFSLFLFVLVSIETPERIWSIKKSIALQKSFEDR